MDSFYCSNSHSDFFYLNLYVPRNSWIRLNTTYNGGDILRWQWRHLTTMCVTSNTFHVQTTHDVQDEITWVKYLVCKKTYYFVCRLAYYVVQIVCASWLGHSIISVNKPVIMVRGVCVFALSWLVHSACAQSKEIASSVLLTSAMCQLCYLSIYLKLYLTRKHNITIEPRHEISNNVAFWPE